MQAYKYWILQSIYKKCVFFLELCFNFGDSNQIHVASHAIMRTNPHPINSATSNSKTEVTLITYIWLEIFLICRNLQKPTLLSGFRMYFSLGMNQIYFLMALSTLLKRSKSRTFNITPYVYYRAVGESDNLQVPSSNVLRIICPPPPPLGLTKLSH